MSPAGVVHTPFLPLRRVAVGGIGEDAVEHELVLADGKRRRAVPGAGRQRAQPEAVDEPVREQRRRLRERQRVHHEHELTRCSGLGNA